MKCFVDTSAFVALYHKNDSFHAAAKEIWNKLRSENATLYTTRDVISETIILVRRRDGYKQALLCGNDLRASPVLEVVYPTKGHDALAWDIFRRFSDKELSFVDCVSFAVMREFNIKSCFTFDENFTQVGLEPVKARP